MNYYNKFRVFGQVFIIWVFKKKMKKNNSSFFYYIFFIILCNRFHIMYYFSYTEAEGVKF
jgi:hypothetical protein